MRSIDEGTFVSVNGVAQWLTLRGTDRSNPALLIIGGPGGGLAALAPFFADWEHEFTLLQWDQPGSGFTFAKSGVEAATMARLVDDGLRVAELACERLRVAKVALLCFSGGTIVGLTMARRRPELFSAYIGSGQIVDWARQDAASFELLLARARARGDETMLRELTAIGPPPYADAATDAMKSKYAGAPTSREAPGLADFGRSIGAALQGMPAGAPYLARGLQWPHLLERAFAAYTALRDEIVAFDARRLGLTFAVPMYFLQGADDLFTVTSEVQAYAAELTAPYVELVQIENAGHATLFLKKQILALLVRHVRPRLLGA